MSNRSGSRFVRLPLLIFLLLVGAPVLAQTQVRVDLYPQKDNTIYEEATTSSNGAGEFLLAGTNAMNYIRRALVDFDLTTLPVDSAAIDSARLTVHVVDLLQTAVPTNLLIHRMHSDWGEAGSDAEGNEDVGAPAEGGDATWVYAFYNTLSGSQLWGGDGNIDGVYELAASSFTDNVGALGVYGFKVYKPSPGFPSMTQDVKDWIAQPDLNFGWLIRSRETNLVGSMKSLGSRDNAGLEPVLSIWYSPPPPTPERALLFDGVDDQVVLPAGLTDGLAEFSIALWARPLNGGMLISDHEPGFWWESVELSTTWFVVNSNNDKGTRQTLSFDSPVDSTWHHYVAVWDGTESKVYIDGSLFAGPFSAPSSAWNSPARFVLGGPSQRPPIKGYLDEVSVWSLALDESQIARVMADTLGPEYYATPDSGMIGYWRFDEPDGDVVFDLTPGANDGTIVGALRTNAQSPVDTETLPTVPEGFALFPNYPNPFSEATRIVYDIARQSYVQVAVFDILGRRVGTLASGTMPPGRHEVLMDGLGLSSGVYIVRMEADTYAAARRIVLNR